MAEKPNNDTNTSASNAAMATGNNGHLDTSKAERHVWLMKCPPVVARAMQNMNQQPPPPLSSDAAAGQTVAKVIVAVDPLRPNDDLASTQFTMDLAGTTDRNTPRRYSMNMSTEFVPMSVFSESSQGKLSVEGKIYHKFDMKPHNENIDDYAKLCRERTNKYMTRSRQIQVINDDSGIRMRPMPGMVDMKSYGSTDKKKAPAKGSETKRTRRDPEEMEKIMFKLFEKQPNWTLKQLIQKTDQPEQFLKDMLKLLCVYNNKGANQGTYELKPEYRRSEDKSDS
ncbi:Transcription initiation factor IIF, small subunit (RAP30) [Handroanthus impetiginosus]|uniref:Transcription initiation factor IIF, small subunit (RAP30) n=1 Tax=Handroanthus impetiginosus TaxID=429701 RepID=A0A2G9GQF5_9LAMI|nr:Transcription initiation factor IIF, small subunit (RAP30) [Handroanthus impetiginosus]